MIRAELTRYALTLLAALALSLAPQAAAAQGTCRCNTGCHQYPGQCVQRVNDSGCSPGYAPFCGTRASSCPQTGWVTCNGQCTCVRIGPVDGGVSTPDAATPDAPVGADVPASMPDAPSPDVVSRDAPGIDVTATDVPASFDVPRVDGATPVDAPVTPSDQPVTTDAPIPSSDRPVVVSDAPFIPSDTPVATDAPFIPADRPVATDAPFTPADRPVADDASVTPMDARPTSDAGCVCDGGVCLSNVCLTERCRYQNELGFICPLPDHTCRIVGDEAWCAPACLDVTCEAGSFCDPSTGACRADECATIRCPTGQVCSQNRCLPAPSGAADGGVGDGGTTAPAVEGCGCRATSQGRSAHAALLLTALAALLHRRRARR